MKREESDAYLMEHPEEGERIRKKTDLKAAREQLLLTGLVQGMNALDIGCASGATTLEMAQIVHPGSVIGLDASQARLEEARGLAASKGIANAQFVHGNAYELQFPDNTFDFVWSRFFLEYLKRPVAAILEMKRVTKLGGRVISADLDGNCLFHYPIDPQLEKGLMKVMEHLGQTGFDPFVGRKLYHYYRQVGFKAIQAHVMAHHVIAGPPTEVDRDNWTEKVNTVQESFASSFPHKAEAEAVARGLKALIDDPEVFTYSPLIIMVGFK